MAEFYPLTGIPERPNPLYPPHKKGFIDLREELAIILHGGNNCPPMGHWVVYRRFDLTTHSCYWNKETREAVGGPAWEYDDEVYRTRRVVGRTGGLISDMELHSEVGEINVRYATYYLEWYTNPKKEDIIYEVSDEAIVTAETRPLEAEPPYLDRFVIRDVIPFRCDEGGRIEYWVCICRRDLVA